MKIIFVNSAQFDVIWKRLSPAQRFTGDIPHPCIVLRHLNTVLLLDEEVEIGSLVDMKPRPEMLTIERLTDAIMAGEYKKEAA